MAQIIEFAKFDQPMRVIVHQHPRKESSVAIGFNLVKRCTSRECSNGIRKDVQTPFRSRGDVIDLPRD